MPRVMRTRCRDGTYARAMKPRELVAVVCLIALTSCSNSARDSDGNTSENKSPETLEPTSVVEKDARYGTVQGLMEAAVEAGYIW